MEYWENENCKRLEDRMNKEKNYMETPKKHTSRVSENDNKFTPLPSIKSYYKEEPQAPRRKSFTCPDQIRIICPIKKQHSPDSLKFLHTRNIHEQFDTISLLGEGSFSEVYLIQSKITHSYYALKRVKHSRLQRKTQILEARTEASIGTALQQGALQSDLALLLSPFVVALHQAWEDEQGRLHLRLEYCAKSNVLRTELLKPLLPRLILEQRIWEILADCLLGLLFLHSFQILHLDLKPENLMIDSLGRVKLGDLGSSIRLHPGEEVRRLHRCQVDFVYAAPETFLKDEASVASDVFSLGLTLWTLCVGVVPPRDPSLWESLREEGGAFSLRLGRYVRRETRRLVREMEDAMPRRRRREERDDDEEGTGAEEREDEREKKKMLCEGKLLPYGTISDSSAVTATGSQLRTISDTHTDVLEDVRMEEDFALECELLSHLPSKVVSMTEPVIALHGTSSDNSKSHSFVSGDSLREDRRGDWGEELRLRLEEKRETRGVPDRLDEEKRKAEKRLFEVNGQERIGDEKGRNERKDEGKKEDKGGRDRRDAGTGNGFIFPAPRSDALLDVIESMIHPNKSKRPTVLSLIKNENVWPHIRNRLPSRITYEELKDFRVVFPVDIVSLSAAEAITPSGSMEMTDRASPRGVHTDGSFSEWITPKIGREREAVDMGEIGESGDMIRREGLLGAGGMTLLNASMMSTYLPMGNGSVGSRIEVDEMVDERRDIREQKSEGRRGALCRQSVGNNEANRADQIRREDRRLSAVTDYHTSSNAGRNQRGKDRSHFSLSIPPPSQFASSRHNDIVMADLSLFAKDSHYFYDERNGEERVFNNQRDPSTRGTEVRGELDVVRIERGSHFKIRDNGLANARYEFQLNKANREMKDVSNTVCKGDLGDIKLNSNSSDGDCASVRSVRMSMESPYRHNMAKTFRQSVLPSCKLIKRSHISSARRSIPSEDLSLVKTPLAVQRQPYHPYQPHPSLSYLPLTSALSPTLPSSSFPSSLSPQLPTTIPSQLPSALSPPLPPYTGEKSTSKSYHSSSPRIISTVSPSKKSLFHMSPLHNSYNRHSDLCKTLQEEFHEQRRKRLSIVGGHSVSRISPNLSPPPLPLLLHDDEEEEMCQLSH